MRFVIALIAVALAGCAATPEQETTVASADSAKCPVTSDTTTGSIMVRRSCAKAQTGPSNVVSADTDTARRELEQANARAKAVRQ